MTTDMSYLTSLNLKHKSTDKLFFNQYKYAIRLVVAGSAAIRGARQHPIVREKIRRDALDRHIKGHNEHTQEVLLNKLYSLHDYIVNTKDIKATVSRNITLLYTNTLEDMYFFKKLDPSLSVTEARIDIEKGTIVRKNSEYKYRIQFKHKTINATVKNGIESFLLSYSKQVKPSKSLAKWANSGWMRYTESHYFIDMNDDKLELVFDLMAPGVKDQVYTIISDK